MSSQSDLNMRHVARLPMRQRIAALGEAILLAHPDQRDEIAMMLIEQAGFESERSDSYANNGVSSAAGPVELIARLPQRWRGRHAQEAMHALANAWCVLSISMKQLAVGLGRDRWIAQALELSQSPDPRARLAAIAIAQDTADPGFGSLVATLLADEHQSVRKAADSAMMRMTMVMLDHLPSALLGEELAKIASMPRIAMPVDAGVIELERCILFSAIADAAWSFASHRCRSPLLCALLVMDRAVATPIEREISARMRRLLSERNHPSHAPLRAVLKRTPCPILRERSFRWLTIAPIATAAIDRLASADSILEHEVVLKRAHLAIRPKRAGKIASLHQPSVLRQVKQDEHDGPLPDRARYAQLSEDSKLGLIRLSSLVTVDDPTRRSMLEPMLADQNTQVRLAACASSSLLDLPDYMYDADPSIARHAALSWSTLGFTPPRPSAPAWAYRNSLSKTNARSPHAWVRRVCQEESDRLSPMNPSAPASRIQARRMYKNDPASFVRLIRDHLADAKTKCDAIMMMRLLGIEHRFELDLIALVQDASCDAKARATGIMALGQVKTSAAQYVLSEAMSDRDDRIRANAVESVPTQIDRILELKADSHHRVRASAIRRVMRESDSTQVAQSRSAGQALLEMFHDPRPMHRLAAAWAAQRSLTGASRIVMGTTWKPLIHEIQTLATRDENPQIRLRAQRCLGRVESDVSMMDHTRSMQAHQGTHFEDSGFHSGSLNPDE